MIFKIIGIIIIAYLIYAFIKRNKQTNGKVTPINLKRRTLSGKQSCYYCKRKVDQLSFYSDGRGKVVGVCNSCKPQAERQALMRI
jgi:hypothetical protein